MLKLTFEAKTVPYNFTGMAEYQNGTKSWYRNGWCHRDNGPAVEYPNGSKFWFKNGEYHRDNGPAIEHSNGRNEWFQNGFRHRENGPAVECANGDKEYWLNGTRFYSEEKFKLELEKLKPTCDNKTVVIDGKQYKLVLV